jgi:hypothetical protein
VDEWRKNLVSNIVEGSGIPAAGADPRALSHATELEIALGMARSEIAYALELGRAHRLPFTGSVGGDDVWLSMGTAKVRFAYDRKNGSIAVEAPSTDRATLTFDDLHQDSFDMRALVRKSIDAAVAAWKAEKLAAEKPSGDVKTPKSETPDSK